LPRGATTTIVPLKSSSTHKLLEEIHEDAQSSLTLELRKMRENAGSPLLAIVARSIQRDKAKREERIEECMKKQLGGMLVAIVGTDWEECKTSWELWKICAHKHLDEGQQIW
jgi:ABC-type methionine transport system ATPase subunit